MARTVADSGDADRRPATAPPASPSGGGAVAPESAKEGATASGAPPAAGRGAVAAREVGAVTAARKGAAKERAPSKERGGTAAAGDAEEDTSSPERLGRKQRRLRRPRLEEEQEEEDNESDATSIMGRQASKLRDMVARPFKGFGLGNLVAEKRTPEMGRRLPLSNNIVLPEKFSTLGDFVKYHQMKRKGEFIPGEDFLYKKCPNDHELKPHQAKKGLYCSECEKHMPRDTTCFRCVECKFRICEGCYSNEYVEPEPPPDIVAETDELSRLTGAVKALHKAAEMDDHARVRLLLSGPQEAKNLPSPDIGLPDMGPEPAPDSGYTPALRAAKEGCALACAALLDFNADPRVRDNHQQYFGDAVWPSEKHPDLYGKRQPHDAKDSGALPGRTVIYWLRLRGKLDEVLRNVFPMTRVNLVRFIAAAVQEHHGEPALVVAARQGMPELAALLLTHQAMGLPPIATADAPGNRSGSNDAFAATTPGWVAAGIAAGQAQHVAGFGATQQGAASPWTSPLAGNKERAAALVMACGQKEWKIATILVGAGVPAPNMAQARDRLGRTSLHVAAAFGSTEVTKLLINAGHPLRLTSMRGRQPIHEACASGHQACALALCNAKADPNVQTEEDTNDKVHLPGRSFSKRGLTAVEMATNRRDPALAALLSAQSPANAASGRGKTMGRVASAPSMVR